MRVYGRASLVWGCGGENTTYAVAPKKDKADIDTLWDIHDWKLTEQGNLLEIMSRKVEGVSLMPYYLIEYLDEMLFFEFTEMLKNGRYVKRCKLCGRYFVLTDKQKRDFCDRPHKGKRTCISGQKMLASVRVDEKA